MRSGTSFFDWTVFKKTICRFWPVWAAYSVIWFVPMPLYALMMLRMDANAYPGVSDGFMENFARDFVPGLSLTSLVFAVFFGVLAAMAVCSHLYNAKSANFFGSLPVRREGLFLTYYLAGLAFLIVPNVVIFLLTLLIEAVGGAVYLPGLLFWLGVTCGECLFFYSMAVFCGMFTGHILALPAFYAIFNGLAFVLYELVQWVFRSFYYGFSGFEGGVHSFVKWLTPVWNLGRSVGTTRNVQVIDGTTMERIVERIVTVEPTGLDVLAAYAVVAVVLAAGSFLLYRARRLESAGDVVSVKPMRPVFKYSVAVCAGLCFGMVTAQIVNMREPGLMVSMLVWAVIGYFVAQMLLDKSFWVFRKWKGAAAVAGVFVLMYLVVGFDLTGFETRVPTVDQVDYVEFSGASVHSLGDGADYNYNELAISDPETVELLIGLHQAAVDQRDLKDFSGKEYSSLTLGYRLKDGSTLTREYGLWVDTALVNQEGSPAWIIQQLYNDRDLYWKIYGFEEAERRMSEEGYRLEQVWLTREYTGDGRDPHLYFYGKDAQALYEAVKEDFVNNRIGVRTVGAESSWNQRDLDFQFAGVGTEGERLYHDVEIYVQDTASSTLAVLERLIQEGAGEYEDLPQSEPVLDVMPDDTVVEYPAVSVSPDHS